MAMVLGNLLFGDLGDDWDGIGSAEAFDHCMASCVGSIRCGSDCGEKAGYMLERYKGNHMDEDDFVSNNHGLACASSSTSEDSCSSCCNAGSIGSGEKPDQSRCYDPWD